MTTTTTVNNPTTDGDNTLVTTEVQVVDERKRNIQKSLLKIALGELICAFITMIIGIAGISYAHNYEGEVCIKYPYESDYIDFYQRHPWLELPCRLWASYPNKGVGIWSSFFVMLSASVLRCCGADKLDVLKGRLNTHITFAVISIILELATLFVAIFIIKESRYTYNDDGLYNIFLIIIMASSVVKVVLLIVSITKCCNLKPKKQRKPQQNQQITGSGQQVIRSGGQAMYPRQVYNQHTTVPQGPTTSTNQPYPQQMTYPVPVVPQGTVVVQRDGHQPGTNFAMAPMGPMIMQPGVMVQPGGTVYPGGMVPAGTMVQPGGMVPAGGMVQPMYMMSPAGQPLMQQGVVQQPTAPPLATGSATIDAQPPAYQPPEQQATLVQENKDNPPPPSY